MSMTVSSGVLTLIVVGVVLGLMLVALAVYVACACRAKRAGSSGGAAALLSPEDGPRGGEYGSGGGGRGSSVSRARPWTFGDLSDPGLRRVRAWIDDVARAAAVGGELDCPTVEGAIAESLLGQEDPGSPPSGYSPRVSHVGSDYMATAAFDSRTRGSSAPRASVRDPLAI